MSTTMSNGTVLGNLRIIDPSRNLDETGTIIIGADGRILAAGKDAQNQGTPDGATVRDCQGLVATPGLVDAPDALLLAEDRELDRLEFEASE